MVGEHMKTSRQDHGKLAGRSDDEIGEALIELFDRGLLENSHR